MIYLVVNNNGEFRLFTVEPKRYIDIWIVENINSIDCGILIPRFILNDRLKGLTWKSEPIKINI